MKKTNIIIFSVGVLEIITCYMFLKCFKSLKNLKNLLMKNENLFNLMTAWIDLYQKRVYISDFLIKSNYKSVAIYGYSHIGKSLYEELKDKIEVKYIIDKNKNIPENGVKIYSPDEKLPKVDCIIVTAISYFNDIELILHDKIECPIISFDDIVSYLNR